MGIYFVTKRDKGIIFETLRNIEFLTYNLGENSFSHYLFLWANHNSTLTSISYSYIVHIFRFYAMFGEMQWIYQVIGMWLLNVFWTWVDLGNFILNLDS